jgi:hypothetical protein
MSERDDRDKIDPVSSPPIIIDRSDRRADSNSETRDRRVETVLEIVETSDVASIKFGSSAPTTID